MGIKRRDYLFPTIFIVRMEMDVITASGYMDAHEWDEDESLPGEF